MLLKYSNLYKGHAQNSVETQVKLAVAFACMHYLQIDELSVEGVVVSCGEIKDGGNGTLMEYTEDLDLKIYRKLLYLIIMYVGPGQYYAGITLSMIGISKL